MPKFYASGATQHHDLSENFTNSLTIARDTAVRNKQGFSIYTEGDNVFCGTVSPNGKVAITDYARTKFLRGSQPAYLEGKDAD